MKSYLALLFVLLTARGDAQAQFPSASISNGLIKAGLYLPDKDIGYYRGSRFDWSGVMHSLEYQGHSYFGQWFERYSPTLHDAIMGPVEAYYPIDFETAKPGEDFLIIGIGAVTRPDDKKYSIATPYPIKNAGKWKVRKKEDQVTFKHKLKALGYAYDYQKTVHLEKGKPELVISHVLKNSGKKAIETNVYNHNFFVMDGQPIGPDFVVRFPYTISGEVQRGNDLGGIRDKEIEFYKTLQKNTSLYFASLQGFGADAKDYDIRIENHKTGAAVRISSDRPLMKLAFWSTQMTLCPEPFTRISVKPGEAFNWEVRYEFYTCEIRN